jgi:hypothetical protein
MDRTKPVGGHGEAFSVSFSNAEGLIREQTQLVYEKAAKMRANQNITTENNKNSSRPNQLAGFINVKPASDRMSSSKNLESLSTENKGYKVMMDKFKSANRTRTYKHIERALTKSTLHRLGSIYENKSWPLRILIGACFLASMVYCTYQIILTVINFASYNVLTVSSVYYEIPAEFPGRIFINLLMWDVEKTILFCIQLNWSSFNFLSYCDRTDAYQNIETIKL